MEQFAAMESAICVACRYISVDCMIVWALLWVYFFSFSLSLAVGWTVGRTVGWSVVRSRSLWLFCIGFADVRVLDIYTYICFVHWHQSARACARARPFRPFVFIPLSSLAISLHYILLYITLLDERNELHVAFIVFVPLHFLFFFYTYIFIFSCCL